MSTNGSARKSIWHFWKCERCDGVGEQTRQDLLQAAFDEIHRTGFQAASLNRILKRTGVTKGALYHHFPSKKALGYAVLDEMIRQQMLEFWIKPLQRDNPVDVMITLLRESGHRMTLGDIRLGCPLANLAQEMSPVDEGFRERIETVYGEWRAGLADALEHGQAAGWVRADINPMGMAVMLVASLEGCLAAAKSAQSRKILQQCGESLIQVLESLRAQGN